jgi:hypothetical protein
MTNPDEIRKEIVWSEWRLLIKERPFDIAAINLPTGEC